MKNIKGSNFPQDFFFCKEAIKKYSLNKYLQRLEEDQSLQTAFKTQLLISFINSLRQDKALLLASHFLGLGLIYEIYHYISHKYNDDQDSTVWKNIYKKISEAYSADAIQGFALRLVDNFPPPAVWKNGQSSVEFLNQKSGKESNSRLALCDLLMLTIFHENPAFENFQELFDQKNIAQNENFHGIIELLKNELNKYQKIGPQQNPLYHLLREPILDSPHSIFGQLDYILKNWAMLLPDYLLIKIRQTLDFISEEESMRGAPGDQVETFVPDYLEKDLYPEYEAFTTDSDWMPRVVLMAKSTYVWLHQLSQKYKREIQRLDQIPNEELDILMHWGFTGLWLIGVWERSNASQKIKKWMGNPEALSSAYSLYDYEIAERLGGSWALSNLRQRLWVRGIRLAADMVPNHMGIYSKWIIEHPDWFLSLAQSPYPAYNFTCENLSDDPAIGVHIEDGYWNRSDASVVFKHVDLRNHKVRYIYHGNDGTSTPWNDTAQLDFLNPEVREAVIQQIIRVAREFPIIRFDAAMTLAKKHIQRLWFPIPGAGGSIPSRWQHAMSSQEFNAKIPNEFWREVVDRISQEAPETLLLAEAFWLMEGYFTRTLGMHRVYNSAFMNMLKMEENHKFRKLIRETLEFNPEILRRYVNYMNNPDEDTAIAQFGKEEKYFGVAIMMVTLPGLPMWGHGQVEGLTEKYGMEYARSYYDESPDQALVERHEKQVFPIMKRRNLFSGVDNFYFYDFFTPSGQVDENVFAYSNRTPNQRALVFYNNRYQDTSGWIHISTPVIDLKYKESQNQEKKFFQKNLGDALGLSPGYNKYAVFRDYIKGLDYIRHTEELSRKGMFAQLKGYEFQVFMDFVEVTDSDGTWSSVHAELAGQGVRDIRYFYKKVLLRPILTPLNQLLSPATVLELFRLIEKIPLATVPASQKKASKIKLAGFFDSRWKKSIQEVLEKSLQKGKISTWFKELERGYGEYNRLPVRAKSNINKFIKNLAQELSGLIIYLRYKEFDIKAGDFGKILLNSEPLRRILRNSKAERTETAQLKYILIIFALIRNLHSFFIPPKSKIPLKVKSKVKKIPSLVENKMTENEIGIFSGWLMAERTSYIFQELLDGGANHDAFQRIIALLSQINGLPLLLDGKNDGPIIREFFSLKKSQDYMKVHEFNAVLFFHLESFEEILDWTFILSFWRALGAKNMNETKFISETSSFALEIKSWKNLAKASGYRLLDFHNLLKFR